MKYGSGNLYENFNNDIETCNSQADAIHVGNEICNNFKDKGVSNFGGDLFHSLM